MNTTSVGMWPDIDPSPLPIDSLTNCRLVFDPVYNPLETRLLREAAEAGAQTPNGPALFTRQAAMPFATRTGRTATGARADARRHRAPDRAPDRGRTPDPAARVRTEHGHGRTARTHRTADTDPGPPFLGSPDAT